MTMERRRLERKLLDDFAFIQIGRDDGGRVLNLSEGGLCFELSSPQQLGRPIIAWFSLDLRERIEVVGELAWIDATKRTGGLKFIALSEGTRRQISRCVRSGPLDAEQSIENKPVALPHFLQRGEQKSVPQRKSAFLKERPRLDPALPSEDHLSCFSSAFQPDALPPDTTHLVPFERY